MFDVPVYNSIILFTYIVQKLIPTKYYEGASSSRSISVAANKRNAFRRSRARSGWGWWAGGVLPPPPLSYRPAAPGWGHYPELSILSAVLTFASPQRRRRPPRRRRAVHLLARCEWQLKRFHLYGKWPELLYSFIVQLAVKTANHLISIWVYAFIHCYSKWNNLEPH